MRVSLTARHVHGGLAGDAGHQRSSYAFGGFGKLDVFQEGHPMTTNDAFSRQDELRKELYDALLVRLGRTAVEVQARRAKRLLDAVDVDKVFRDSVPDPKGAGAPRAVS